MSTFSARTLRRPLVESIETENTQLASRTYPLRNIITESIETRALDKHVRRNTAARLLLDKATTDDWKEEFTVDDLDEWYLDLDSTDGEDNE